MVRVIPCSVTLRLSNNVYLTYNDKNTFRIAPTYCSSTQGISYYPHKNNKLHDNLENQRKLPFCLL